MSLTILRGRRASRRFLALSSAAIIGASCGRWDAPTIVNGAGGAVGEGGVGMSPAAGAGDAEPGTGGNAGTGEVSEGGTSSTALTGGDSGTGSGPSPGAGGSGAVANGGGTTQPEGGAGGLVENGGAPSNDDDDNVVSPGPCGFDVRFFLSSAIGTVAIVKWSVELEAVESAEIQFGLDEGYGMVAPVDLDENNYRTLLLGMKPSRDYHARIVVHGDDKVCESDDFVVTTGPVRNGLPRVTRTTLDAAKRSGGYLISSFISRGPAFIIDADGDYVWWSARAGLGRAQMSYDGKTMWYGNVNVVGGSGFIASVPMDGEGIVTHREFGDPHHDFTVLPDGTIGYIEHDGTCDRIMERSPEWEFREVINVHDAHGGTDMCHTNSIHYHPGDDTYTFSDLNQNAYVKVTRSGEVVWVLGGDTSDFTGDGAEWTRQHGHDLIAPDRLLFFNNGPFGQPSTAVEVALDFDQMTATRVWSYLGSGRSSVVYGDVQRLDNGNTLVTYSTAATIEEVTPDGELVESLQWSGDGVGYAMKRASLYGPPPIR